MKVFFLKLLLFVAALLTMQMVGASLYPPDLPDEILQLDRHLRNGADIIFLGDSTVIYPAGEVSTAEILQEFQPQHTVGQVAHPAYNLDLYRYYAGYVTRSYQRPKAVVIPINMRSFSPEWDLRPIYQFEPEKAVLTYGPRLAAIFYRPFDILGGFDPAMSQQDFLNVPVFNGQTPGGRVADFERLLSNGPFESQPNDVETAYYSNLPSEDESETLEDMLIYYYMYELTPAHRKIQSMLLASRLLKASGIEPIFYITPINYELGDKALGEAFRRRIIANVAVVEAALRTEQAEPLNLVFELEAYNFFDSEHLTENGKARVAEALASIIDPLPPRRSPPPSSSTPATNRPGVATVEPQPAASELTEAPNVTPTTPTPAASPIAPTPTNTRVVPLSSAPSAGQGTISGVEFIGAFEPVGNYAVDLYRVRYRTLSRDERPVDVRANIYIPQTADEPAFPVLVYSGGTTGLSPACAPLNELRQDENWGGYHYQMLEYAAQGFIVVWPNGQGFDDSQPAHPYFIAESQGRTMLDAARAVYGFFDEAVATELAVEPMAAVFFGGYSSGGHAAFAAKDLASRYAPDLMVKGVIGHGPTTNIEILLKENPIFSPYLIYAYHAFFGAEVVDPVRVFQDRWLASFKADVMAKCVDDIFSYYSPNARLIYRPEFREALYSDRLQSFWPSFGQLLRANAAGLSPAGNHIPALILQGTADMVVTPPSQKQFVTSLCRLGNRVTYLTYPAINHAETRRVSFRDAITWMHDLAEDNLPESSCSSLMGQ